MSPIIHSFAFAPRRARASKAADNQEAMILSNSSHPNYPKGEAASASTPSASSAAVLGTCRVGRAAARRLSSQTALARSEECRSEPGFKPSIADAADGADGIFDRRAHPDYSLSGSAFTTEGNVDAERPKKCLRPTQVAGEGARIFGAPMWSLVRQFPRQHGFAGGPVQRLHAIPYAYV